MTTYTIKKGEVNAKPNKTALRFVRSGAAWRVRFKLDTGEKKSSYDPVGKWETVSKVPVPHTHIKLLGLYWSGWMVWQRMREAWRKAEDTQVWPVEDRAYWAELVCYWNCFKAALRQYLAWTHGNSARVIAAWRERLTISGPIGSEASRMERGVSLSTYYYLQGRGAVTTGSPVRGQEIAWLPEDPDNPGWTVWGTVQMNGPSPVNGHQFQCYGDDSWFGFPLSRRPWFFGLCKPHARNGGKGSGREHAPCDLTFEMERI